MDARTLLDEAMERNGWSLTELAARAGTSRAMLWKYRAGRMSPSLRTIERVLAAAGLQLRVELEPLHTAVDARVDDMLSGDPEVDVAAIEQFAERASREYAWGYEDPDTREVGTRSGRIT